MTTYVVDVRDQCAQRVAPSYTLDNPLDERFRVVNSDDLAQAFARASFEAKALRLRRALLAGEELATSLATVEWLAAAGHLPEQVMTVLNPVATSFMDQVLIGPASGQRIQQAVEAMLHRHQSAPSAFVRVWLCTAQSEASRGWMTRMRAINPDYRTTSEHYRDGVDKITLRQETGQMLELLQGDRQEVCTLVLANAVQQRMVHDLVAVRAARIEPLCATA